MASGIDYGMGQTNIDKSNGIRFGVLPMHAIYQAWCDSAEADYGEPTCGECGNDLVEYDDDKHGDYPEIRGCSDYACESCERVVESQDAYGDEPNGWHVDDGEYKAWQDSHGDVMVCASPYYTRAEFCSPCAPGACYLLNADEDGERAYCFGHDWFEGGRSPYPVYRVTDDTLVEPE